MCLQQKFPEEKLNRSFSSGNSINYKNLFSFDLANSLKEYERTLSFTILGIKKPLAVSFAQRLIIVLLVTPSTRLTSIGVNSNRRFLIR